MKDVNQNGYIRINKTEARNMFKAGKTVYLAPCNVTPSPRIMMSIFRTCTDVNHAEAEFEQGLATAVSTACNKENGSTMYFYKKSESQPSQYMLKADFGDKVRIQNVYTGNSVTVDKSKVIERINSGLVEIKGYSVSPDQKNLIAYR